MENTTAPQKEQGRGKMEACLKNGVESFKWTDDEIQLLLFIIFRSRFLLRLYASFVKEIIAMLSFSIAVSEARETARRPMVFLKSSIFFVVFIIFTCSFPQQQHRRMRQGQSSYRSFFWTSSARSHGNGTERLRTVPLFVSLILSFHFLERNDVI